MNKICLNIILFFKRVDRRGRLSCFFVDELLFCFLIFLLLLPLFNISFASDWWNGNWKYRREIIINPQTVSEKTGDVVYIEFPVASLARADGKDIRVISQENKEIPYLLISHNFEDKTSLVFPVKNITRKYYIYYGNPKVTAPPQKFDYCGKPILEIYSLNENIKRRLKLLFQQTRLNKDEPITFSAVIKLIKNQCQLMGREILDSPTLGFNPFSKDSSYIAVISGWLKVNISDQYLIGINAHNSAFLFVDQNVLVSWPGTHPPDGGFLGHHAEKIYLNTNPHRLDLVNIQTGPGQGCTSGFTYAKTPGLMRNFNRNDFPSLIKAKPSYLEIINTINQIIPDFNWTIETDLGLEKMDVSLISFSNLSSGAPTSSLEYLWDFGDGITSTQVSPVHVYLGGGIYPITLKITHPKQGMIKSVTQRVRAFPRNWEVTSDYSVRFERIFKILQDYPFDKLSIHSLLNIRNIYIDLGDEASAQKALLTSLEKINESESDQYLAELFEACESMWFEHESIEEGKSFLQKFAEKCKNPFFSAKAKINLGEIILKYENKIDEAEAIFKEEGKKFENKNKSLYLPLKINKK